MRYTKKFKKISYPKFLFHIIFLPESLELSVEWFAFSAIQHLPDFLWSFPQNFFTICYNLVPRISHLPAALTPGRRKDEKPWERGCVCPCFAIFVILFEQKVSNIWIKNKIFFSLSSANIKEIKNASSCIVELYKHAGIFKNTREVHREARGAAECFSHFLSFPRAYITQQCTKMKFFISFIKC